MTDSQPHPERNTDIIIKVTWAGMGINVILSLLKLSAGIVGHSQALIADAVHSLSDITTDIAVLFGVKYWSAPPDKDHPYGHGKIETFITFFIGIILAAAALGIGYEALATMKDSHDVRPGVFAFLGALVSIVLKEAAYRWTAAAARKVNSSALMANAWHHRTDALSSIPVAIAVMVAIIFPEWSFLDHVGAFAVSLFILHAAYKILKPAFLDLTDAGVSYEIYDKFKHQCSEVSGVRTVHAIRSRRSGSGILVDLHVLVDPDISVKAGHDIAENVKKHLISNNPDIIDVVVHVEPM